MDFHNYNENANEYYYPPPSYTNTSNYYDLVQPPQFSSPPYPPDESNELQWVDYTTNYYYPKNDYQSGTNQEMNYYMHNFSETQLIQYQPAPYEIGYISSNPIMYSVSQSTKKVRFTLPEFDEYDPTPYGGGYDAEEYYGKPLPPSDKVCYPPEPPQDFGFSLEGFSYDSTPRPYGKNDETPSSKNHQNRENKPQSGGRKEGDSVIDVPELFLKHGHKNHAEEVDDSSDSDDGDDADGILENGRVEEKVLQIPYGAGLESMDICESIFGYWPCLEKMNREKNQNHGGSSEDCYNDQWKSAADYLFGGPFGYGEQRDGGNYAFNYGNNYNYHG